MFKQGLTPCIVTWVLTLLTALFTELSIRIMLNFVMIV